MLALFHLSSVSDVPSKLSSKLSWVGTPILSCIGNSYGESVKLLEGYIILWTPNASIRDTLT